MNLIELHNIFKRDGIIFLSYGGFLSQSLIAAMTENLEREAENKELSMRLSTNIFTVFIELSQNMMKYIDIYHSISPTTEAFIMVGTDCADNYFVISRNIIKKEDAQPITDRLNEIKTLSRDQIKQKYRDLRRSGRDMHDKGAGIGLYEVAKCANNLEFEIMPLDNHTCSYMLKANIGEGIK